MQKKYQVFVSSTFRDLSEERQDAIRNILDLGHIPAGMELFPASDTDQLEYIKKVIDECDYYILIMGGRYGSLDQQGVSYTEREYDYAVESGKVVLAFPHANPPSIPVSKSDTGERMVQNLEAFRDKVMTGRLVRTWANRQELDGLVIKSLVRAVSDYPAVGWIRANVAANEEVLQQLNELQQVRAKLEEEISTLRAATQPNLNGLASGSDLQPLRFEYRFRMPGGSYDDRVATVNLSWDEIFRAIATEINVARPVESIDIFIDKYLRENKSISRTYSLFSSDRAVIKNQLVGLGLITTRIGSSKDNKTYEWMTLTPLGRQKIAEMLAVRAGMPDQGG